MSETGEPWLIFAREDLRMAQLALREGIYNQACFHAQQCTEKAIKGWLAQQGQIPPRTHRMADLLVSMPAELIETMGDEVRLLDRFYIPTRYPDALPGVLPEGMPRRRDAEEALDLASNVLQWIEDAIHPDQAP